MTRSSKRSTWNYRGPLFISLLALFTLFGGVGVWAMNARISGAVIGKGSLTAETLRQAVQHERGGVVAEIHVGMGDMVKAGDTLLTLDSQVVRSDLESVRTELLEMLTNAARLRAEIDNKPVVNPSPETLRMFETHPGLLASLERQQRQLDAARSSLRQKFELMRHQIIQIVNRRAGVSATLASKRERLKLAQQEYERLRSLDSRGLVLRSKVVNAQTKVSTISEDIGMLQAQVAELGERINELKSQLTATLNDPKDKAIAELNRIQPLKAILEKRLTGATSRLSESSIVAPSSGTIHDLRVLGPRSVVRAGQPLMFIIPSGTPLTASVRIDARDVEEVNIGHTASLRFPAFSKRSTPLLPGIVKSRSADSFFDSGKNLHYYNVEIEFDEASVDAIEGLDLVSGMPVEAFITTDERSPLTYIVRPISIYFEKAFRDS